jgi:hypothetical protein
MLVMFDVTDPVRVHTMSRSEGKSEVIDLKGLLARERISFGQRWRRWCRRRSRRI